MFILFSSTPLPPLPLDRKQLLNENQSNRSSNSSGQYGINSEGQVIEGDDIYTKPMVRNYTSRVEHVFKPRKSKFFVDNY